MIQLSLGLRIRPRSTQRSGAAVMMLILALALLVGTFATTVVRTVSNERRNVSHQESIATLEAAIAAVGDSNAPQPMRLRLPVDDARGQFVLVETVDVAKGEPEQGSTIEYRATFYVGDRAGLSIARKVENRQ